MYFYKTFQKSLHNFKFCEDCSYVTFMKTENLDNGYYKIIYFYELEKIKYKELEEIF